jgi:hypothetical protein
MNGAMYTVKIAALYKDHEQLPSWWANCRLLLTLFYLRLKDV